MCAPLGHSPCPNQEALCTSIEKLDDPLVSRFLVPARTPCCVRCLPTLKAPVRPDTPDFDEVFSSRVPLRTHIPGVPGSLGPMPAGSPLMGYVQERYPGLDRPAAAVLSDGRRGGKQHSIASTVSRGSHEPHPNANWIPHPQGIAVTAQWQSNTIGDRPLTHRRGTQVQAWKTGPEGSSSR